MKGLDAPVMIAIIIAVIAGILILYLLWSKGFLPFLGGVSESECRSSLLRICSNKDWSKANGVCTIYFKGAAKSNLESCLANPTGNEVACNDFCATLSSGG